MKKEIVEYLWDCTSCGGKGILGRYTSCPACNASVPSADCYYEPSAAAPAVSDPELLRLALAGENYRCAFCGGIERNLAGNCERCGGNERQPGRTVNTPPPLPGQVAPLPRRKAASLLLGLVALAAALVWGFSIREIPGTVSAREWTRTVVVSTWAQTTTTGWLHHDGLVETPHADPVDGAGERAGVENLRDCAQKVRTTARVVSGSHQECSTSSVWWIHPAQAGSFHNGFGSRPASHPASTPRYSGGRSTGHSTPTERSTPTYHAPVTRCQSVTDYTSAPVYDDLCTYDTWAWGQGAPVTETGSGEPSWPPVTVSSLQRASRSETYEITVAYRDESYQMAVEAGDFASYLVGDPVCVFARGFGWVSRVERGVCSE